MVDGIVPYRKRGRRPWRFLSIGDRFGTLTVVSQAESVGLGRRWLCRCDCGKTATVRQANLFLAKKPTRSCGCLRKKKLIAMARTHGMSESPEYSVWVAMIQRCTNPKESMFEYYGGRGISVCPRWRESFQAFYEDVGARPAPGHTIDRKDVNGNYERGNVRWATRSEQAANRRVNVYITIGGVTRHLAE